MRYTRWTMSLLAAVLAASLAAGPALAEDGNGSGGGHGKTEEKKPDFPPFEEVTKDMQVKEGFLTLYHDKESDKLLARIPKAKIGKPFLMASSISGGRNYAGWQWGSGAVYFERHDKKLALLEADPRYVKADGTPVGDVIARTYTDTIITAVPIVTEAGGDPVINLDGLLKTDLVGASMLFGGTMNPQFSKYDKIKNFEHNTELNVKAAMMQPRGGGEFVGIHYSFSGLPEGSGYQPREADGRIGYFLTAVKDWSTDHNADTIFKRYIHRWQLRKAQPDQAVSDVRPEDQIVFYIENSVPVEYRRWVREGILMWNKAFEAAGIRNAIAVRQQSSTDPSSKDLDPEDVRYNFIRWIVSGRAYAMGPSRVNPFTGQILDADIVFDDAMVRFLLSDYDVVGPRAGEAFEDKPLQELLEHHPEWAHQPASWELQQLQPDAYGEHPHVRAADIELPWGQKPVHGNCQIGIGASRQMAMAAMIKAKASGELSPEFIGQAIKYITAHEVGHTLGLRHNFKASSWKPLADIYAADAAAGEATVGSVMDYVAFSFAESEDQQHAFASPVVGPYDMWAIEYGYRPFTKGEGEDAPKNESEMLAQIGSRSADPGHDYATDEDFSVLYPDPTVHLWDNGRNPLDFAKKQVNTAEMLWGGGLEWAVEDGKSYSRARQVFGTLLGDYAQGSQIAARMIGGQYLHRDHKGDPNGRAPVVVISAEQQREAMDYVAENVLACKGFDFDPDMLNRLSPGRFMHWDSDEADREIPFSVHDRVAAIHGIVLFQLMNPFTVNRVYDAEIKVPGDQDAFSTAELFSRLQDSIWAELDRPLHNGTTYSNRNPMINSYRRNLQRMHVQNLIDLVVSNGRRGLTPDALSLARQNLKQLNGKIERLLANGGSHVDEYTTAHLQDTNRRIEKAMEAQYLTRR